MINVETVGQLSDALAAVTVELKTYLQAQQVLNNPIRIDGPVRFKVRLAYFGDANQVIAQKTTATVPEVISTKVTSHAGADSQTTTNTTGGEDISVRTQEYEEF